MIVLTVGTWAPFDRLVRDMDRVIGDEEVFAQIGGGSYIPVRMKWERFVEVDEFKEMLRRCDAVVSHAGCGTIISCIRMHKPVLVMPRLRKYGEAINDHQVDTAVEFEQNRCVLACYEGDDVKSKYEALKAFSPRTCAGNTGAVVEYLSRYIENIERTATHGRIEGVTHRGRA